VAVSGVGDDDVDRADRGFDVIHRVQDRRVVGDIENARDGAAGMQCPKFVGVGFAPDRAHYDVAVLDGFACDCLSQAGAHAGDQEGLDGGSIGHATESTLSQIKSTQCRQ